MANLLQKCFLPKYQVKILNFIDENRDKIQTRTAENEYYKWQTYEILSNKYSLRVTRRENITTDPTPNQTDYTFVCRQSTMCDNWGCRLKNSDNTDIASDGDNTQRARFIFQLYSELSKNYHETCLAQQNIPCAQGKTTKAAAKYKIMKPFLDNLENNPLCISIETTEDTFDHKLCESYSLTMSYESEKLMLLFFSDTNKKHAASISYSYYNPYSYAQKPIKFSDTTDHHTEKIQDLLLFARIYRKTKPIRAQLPSAAKYDKIYRTAMQNAIRGYVKKLKEHIKYRPHVK